MGSDEISFDVFGVCTTRDIFGLVPYNRFPVRKYFQLSFPPAFDTSNIFSINPLSPDEFNGNSGYMKRTIAADVNRTVISDLENSGANWIIIDLRSVPKGLWEVSFGGETHYYSVGNFVKKDSIIKSVEAKGLKVDSIRIVDVSEVPKMDEYVDEFCDFLKKRYGRNIILVELKEALWLLDKNGNVTFKQNASAERNMRIMDTYFMRILKKLDCHFIRTPPNIIYDSYNHFGDAYRVHYVQEWFDYANECIEVITSGSRNYRRKLEILDIEFTNKMDLIRSENLLSRTNTLKRFEKRLDDFDPDTDVIEDLVSDLDAAMDSTEDDLLKAGIQEFLARISHEKKYGVVDNEKAAEWMRKAVENGSKPAKNGLFDILWDIDTPDSLSEMVSLAFEGADSNDPEMMGRLGRAYREGKGVQKSLDVAAEWMRKSADSKCAWAKTEYCDILWEADTADSLSAMVEYAQSESKKGNVSVNTHLARAYC